MKILGSYFRRFYSFRWVASIVLLLFLDLCTYLAFRETSGSSSIPHMDKIMHGLGFCAITILGHVSLHFDFFPRMRLRIAPMLFNALIWLGYGLFIELGQRMLSYRSFSLADLAADGLGILLGCAFCKFINLYPRSTQPHG